MEWKFAKHTELNDIVGFKDNDIEKFGAYPAKSIVREAIQNSCDALDIKNGQSQVKVAIRTGEVKKTDLPGFDSIEKHIRSCLSRDNDSAENEEIQRHIHQFPKDRYSYLEIADYNTTGMGHKTFQSLTQGIFKSTKANSGSQGSKGVGKAAYYAASYLRTMLVSTKNEEGNRYRGAAKISNHQSPIDDKTSLNYKGFYGDLEIKPLKEIPSLFQRKEKGTSVFVIGFWDIKDFKKQVIQEVLRNYWFAIISNQLVVTIENDPLDASNLGKFMEEYFPIYRDYRTGSKQNPRPYYETYINGKSYEADIVNIGKCKLWLCKNDEFNLGAVARFRKTKMLIYKENELDSGFAGVFLCDNEQGNKFLKDIENDAHDTWDPKLNHNVTAEANKTLSEIKSFIQSNYLKFSGIGDSTSFSIDKLDNLFGFEGNSTSSAKRGNTPKKESIPSDNQRDRILGKHSFQSSYKDNKLRYKLNFKSLKSVKGQKFKIYIGTDSSRDSINIIDISQGEFEGNTFVIDVKKGVNIIEFIELETPYLVAPAITIA